LSTGSIVAEEQSKAKQGKAEQSQHHQSSPSGFKAAPNNDQMKSQLETAPPHDQRPAISPGQIRVQRKAKQTTSKPTSPTPPGAPHHRKPKQCTAIQNKTVPGECCRKEQTNESSAWCHAFMGCAVLCCAVPNYLLARRRSTWIMNDLLYNDHDFASS
jgi:hypothetical protein